MLDPDRIVFHRGGLVFALRHGEHAHVDDVPNGLACGCVCEECAGQLVARNHGLIRRSHFAHAAGQECGNTGDAGLARCAAEILAETKQLLVPERPGVWPPVSRLVVIDSAVAVVERGKPPEVHVTAAGRELRLFVRPTGRIPPTVATEAANRHISALLLEVRPDLDGIITAGTLAAALVQEHFARQWLYNARPAVTPPRPPPPPPPPPRMLVKYSPPPPIAEEPAMVAEPPPAEPLPPPARDPGPRFCWRCGQVTEFHLRPPGTLRCAVCDTEFLGSS